MKNNQKTSMTFRSSTDKFTFIRMIESSDRNPMIDRIVLNTGDIIEVTSHGITLINPDGETKSVISRNSDFSLIADKIGTEFVKEVSNQFRTDDQNALTFDLSSVQIDDFDPFEQYVMISDTSERITGFPMNVMTDKEKTAVIKACQNKLQELFSKNQKKSSGSLTSNTIANEDL